MKKAKTAMGASKGMRPNVMQRRPAMAKTAKMAKSTGKRMMGK
jgi:hypothetical protein